jgi:hypothetical protein
VGKWFASITMVRRVCELTRSICWSTQARESQSRRSSGGRHQVGVSLRGRMSKIRESGGDLCRVTGDGMLVEFASAVDAVTFAVGTRAARYLRFCETDPPCDGCFLIWKRRPSY